MTAENLKVPWSPENIMSAWSNCHK